MTAIAILGSGRVAASLATGLKRGGHDITIGTRRPDDARADWKGPEVTFATPASAIAGSEIIFNATPGDTSVERLSALAGSLAGKLLVDVANATIRDAAGGVDALIYPGDSLAERLQAALPATSVVKTLNTMLAPVMSDPGLLSASPSVFLSGDDADAKDVVRGLLADMGWATGQMIDLGGIASARGPEAVMLMVSGVMRAVGFRPVALSIVM